MNTIIFTGFRTLSAILFLMLAGVFVYGGGAGTLDFTFNGTGYKFNGFGGGNDVGQDTAVQPDGKIVVVGYTYKSSEALSDVALARYNADGTLDTTFGVGGKVVTPASPGPDQAFAVAIQPDGKIVTAGYVAGDVNGATKDFLLIRYNANGTLDTTFGLGGKVRTAVTGSDDFAYAVALQSDGKIVVAGNTATGSAVVRYNANGSPDFTFGGGSIVLNTIVGSAFSLAIQTNGKIVTAGGAGSDMALARYNTDGSPDTSFDGDGIVTTVIFDSAIAYSIALQSDGKILAGGTAISGPINSGERDFAIVRYHADGSLDTSFDGDGRFTTGLLAGDQLNSVAIQPDGKIVGVGYTQANQVQPYFAALRCNPNGSLDNSFGSGGTVGTVLYGTPPYDFDRANSMALQPDGRIVAIGISRHGGDDFALVRYNSNGSLDTNFDGDGKLASDVGDLNVTGMDVIVQPDGKVLTATTGMYSFSLIRSNPDGSLDASFGNGGKVMSPDGHLALPADMMLQSDGKIILTGGEDLNSNVRQIVVLRYNPDGSPDTTFDGDGKVVTMVLGACSALGGTIQPDGKIVIAGYAYNFQQQTYYLIVLRYNTDGSRDMSFNGDGTVLTTVLAASESGQSVIAQPDGKILVGGTNGTFALIRLNANGSFDTGFGAGGLVTTPMRPGGGSAYIQAMKLLPDGRIVAGGSTSSIPNGSDADLGVVRYNPDGSLDTSFDSDGKVFTPVGPGIDHLYGIAVQADGKIVAAGRTYIGPDFASDLALVRYNTDGSLDSSYGSGGKSVIDLGYKNDAIFGITLDTMGKAIVTGSSWNLFTARIMADDAPLVDIGGRVTNANGNGIANVSISIGNNVDNPRYTITNGLGYYVFPAMPSNEVYVISTSSKRYSFLPDAHTVTVTATYWNGDFVGTAYSNREVVVKAGEKVTTKSPELAPVKQNIKGPKK